MIRAEITGSNELQKQLKELLKEFPQEIEQIVTHTAIVDVESFIKRNPIPVDTGRLRASFHTKRVSKPTHRYNDDEGNSFDGTLRGKVYKDSVLVGSNVEYAEFMNERGGGGEFSGRTVGGMKRAKGYAKGFFDRAVENGEKRFIERLEAFLNGLGDSV